MWYHSIVLEEWLTEAVKLQIDCSRAVVVEDGRGTTLLGGIAGEHTVGENINKFYRKKLTYIHGCYLSNNYTILYMNSSYIVGLWTQTLAWLWLLTSYRSKHNNLSYLDIYVTDIF